MIPIKDNLFKLLNFVIELKKEALEHESSGDTNCIWRTWKGGWKSWKSEEESRPSKLHKC